MYITLDAGRQIRKLLEKQDMPEREQLAVAQIEAAPREQDQVFDGPEDSKIYVDPKSFKFLEGTQLDYDTSLLSKGFVINNPKAKATCGCGTSFSLS